MLSPTFRVRSFNINDISLYPISLSWQPTKEDEGNAEANANAYVIDLCHDPSLLSRHVRLVYVVRCIVMPGV
jgi:hypothetical protein